MRILLVEDSPIERHQISSYLQDLGLDLTVAENGTDAWEVLRGPDAPTFALLDWVLPEIDGIDYAVGSGRSGRRESTSIP